GSVMSATGSPLAGRGGSGVIASQAMAPSSRPSRTVAITATTSSLCRSGRDVLDGPSVTSVWSSRPTHRREHGSLRSRLVGIEGNRLQHIPRPRQLIIDSRVLRHGAFFRRLGRRRGLLGRDRIVTERALEIRFAATILFRYSFKPQLLHFE